MKVLRLLVLLTSVLLVAVVSWAVVRRALGDDTAAAAGCTGGDPVRVSGIIGSEKEAFLRDPRVGARLSCLGLTLVADSKGSRDMVTTLSTGRDGYDFAFPSSTPAAQKIMELRAVDQVYNPFSSVMAVATWKPVVAVLREAGVVISVDDQDVVDVRALIELARKNTRWNQLPGNTGSANRNTVLLRTTDPRDSSSAIMFLSIASTVLNDDRTVPSVAGLPKVMPDLCRLMSYQGQKEPTSQRLFEQYLANGAARSPLTLVYEQQFLDRASKVRVPDGGEHVMLFPSPTVYSKHTLVPFTDAGRTLGRLLEQDQELQNLAAAYGFRLNGRTDADRPEPPTPVEPPAYEVLEAMLDQLGSFDDTTGKCVR